MIQLRKTVAKTVAALCVVAVGTGFAVNADDAPASKPAADAQSDERVLDLSQLSIPVDIKNLTGTDGKSFLIGHSTDNAWAAKVASGNPRSPAAEDGVVVVGSGGGARVYGYDVESGKRRWTDTSKDAGISNIVISLGHAYYTTYSCTLERVRISDGKHSFSKYLAPTVSCAPDVTEDFAACAYTKDGHWNVSVHGTEKGGQRWKKNVGNSGVLTAPVINEEDVFFATSDGKVSKLNSHGGKTKWEADLGAVSAPVATPWGLLVTTTWNGKGKNAAPAPKPKTAAERKRYERETVTKNEVQPGTLVGTKDRRIALFDDLEEKPEGKSAGKVSGPRASLDFQGLRPGVSKRHVVFAYDGKVVCVDPTSGQATWSVKVANDKSAFVRPVCHEGLVIVASNSGNLVALEEETGALIWSYQFKGQSFRAEPAVDEDRVFVTTGGGQLISMPIGLDNVELGGAAGAEGGVEGSADIYWKVQKAFRRVRNIVKNIKQPEVKAPDEKEHGASNGNGPDDGAPAGGDGNDEAILPPEDEEEEMTKGQWERREARRAARAKSQGKKYERKPFKRN